MQNRYTPSKLLGISAMSRTFLAWDDQKNTHCVIKQFTPQAWKTSNLKEISARFQQEVERLEQLGKHPQIPSLIDSFSQGGCPYLVQEFIEGLTLEGELSQGEKFTEAKVWQLLTDFLPVLDYVHNQDVLHRDIKPENLIRRKSDDKIVLVDFGAAKIITPSRRRGTVIGSPGYAAPEQTFGNATKASDIYSLGLTCLHLMTGMEPLDLFSQDGHLVWRDFLVDNPVSNTLGEVLEKMTQPFLQLRYSSTSDLLGILKEQRQTSSKSGVRHTLDSLTVKQKNFLYKQVFPDAIPFLPGKPPAPSQIVEEVYQFLEAAVSDKRKSVPVIEKIILEHWLGEIGSILETVCKCM
nr:serine/threonine-protein kinase [Phormidium sp. FACHB-592]